MPPIHCHPSVTVWITNSKPLTQGDFRARRREQIADAPGLSQEQGLVVQRILQPPGRNTDGVAANREQGQQIARRPQQLQMRRLLRAGAQQPDGLPTVDESYGQIGEFRPRQQQHIGQHMVRPSAQRRANDDLACTPGQGVR